MSRFWNTLSNIFSFGKKTKKIKSLEEALQVHKDENEKLSKEAKKYKQKNRALEEALQAQKDENENLTNEIKTQKQKIGILERKVKTAHSENENLMKEEEMQKQKIDILGKKVKTERHENKNLALEAEEHKRKIRNFDLISDALKAKPPENSFIREFASLIENDFKKGLCNVEHGSNNAENLRKLDDILKEMKLIASCPKLHSKSIGAIGGGFSSGKSSFINSFLVNSKVTLAEGIKPVTAIPSYVVSDQDSQVNGISFNGGRFPIALDMYEKISHEFMKSFDFNLKEIILYTTVFVPLDNRFFENLCLIDTPGYNPPGSGNTEHDFETARKSIENAEFLIWTVGLDTNGTIPQSDINFLNKLDDFGIKRERHLYIVANKAQMKTADARESILDKFEETLDDNDFQYDGISAYNSREKEQKKKQLSYRKMDLFEFIEKHNKPGRKYDQLKGMLGEVFKDYLSEANRDFDDCEKKRKEVNALILRALQSGHIDIYDNKASVELENGLNNLVHYFQPKVQKDERLKRIEDLRDKFLNCLNSFCEYVSKEHMTEEDNDLLANKEDNEKIIDDKKPVAKVAASKAKKPATDKDAGKKAASKTKPAASSIYNW
jgi:hypothetical protein